MIQLSAQSQILIALSPQDFRKGIDGFVYLCRHEFSQDPKSGTFFVFINKTKTMIRVLAYDGNGFWLMTKRLSKGKFRYWPQGGELFTELMAKQLRRVLQNRDVEPYSRIKTEKNDKNT
jgi:transposase